MIAVLLATVVNLDKPGHFIHWRVIQLSLANLVVIVLMVVVFVSALVVPFQARTHAMRSLAFLSSRTWRR